MKKRLIPFILAAALLCGCGTAKSGGDASNADSSVSSETSSASSEKANEVSSAAESAESVVSAEADDEKKSDAATEESSKTESEIIDKLKTDEGYDKLPDDEAMTADEDPYEGSYAESVAGRGIITITKGEGITYNVNVLWSSSAFETAAWTMSGEFNGRGVLNYTNGKKVVTTYSEDGSYTDEEIYSDGTGYFQMGSLDDGSGSVTVNWSDDKENIAEDCVFVKQ